MKGFPVELLFVLAFLGVLLFNYLMQRAARRRQQEEAAAQPEPPPQPLPEPEEAFEDYWGRKPVPAPAAPVVPRPVPQAVQAEPPAPRRVHPLRALLRDRRGLRHAIVLMTVLGPCRAQEPPER